MVSRITISEAAARLDDLADRVRTGEEFLIEKGGKDVLRIGPAEPRQMNGRDFVELMKRLPPPDDAYLDEVEEITRNQGELPVLKWE